MELGYGLSLIPSGFFFLQPHQSERTIFFFLDPANSIQWFRWIFLPFEE
jgi:hypothetical protein